MDLDLHWWVRLVHVTAATMVLGGAALALALTLPATGSGESSEATALAAAEWYEWIFWVATPLLIATGIGNLGAFGTFLPDPGTRWGQVLSLKLFLFAGLLLLSVVRTLVVVRTLEGSITPRRNTWRWFYGATTVVALLILVQAEALAHG
jgi:putative copper export protein